MRVVSGTRPSLRTPFESLRAGGKEDAHKHIKAWPKPSEIKPGIILAYKILTPWSAPTADLTDTPPSLVQTPNAPSGHANETMVLIVRAGMKLELVNATHVGELTLSSGERVVVANHQIVMPEVKIPSSGRSGFFSGKSKEDLNSDHLRALVFLRPQRSSHDPRCPRCAARRIIAK
jgi:hypothetical protein